MAWATPLSAGSDRWLRVCGRHFEIYTPNSEHKASAAIRMFETVYAALQPSFQDLQNRPAVIVAFESEAQFEDYRLIPGTAAYYQEFEGRDYIVLRDLGAGLRHYSLHEVTHMVIRRAGWNLPLWLNEGLAEVYGSAADPAPAQAPQNDTGAAMIGSLFAVREPQLTGMPSPRLAAYYRNSLRLTRMLAFGDRYRGQWPELLRRLAAGQEETQCLSSLFGKDLSAIAADLAAYESAGSADLPVLSLEAEVRVPIKVTQVPALEVDLLKADLLASHAATAAQGETKLRQISTAYPEDYRAELALGKLALRQKDLWMADVHFSRARERGARLNAPFEGAMLPGFAVGSQATNSLSTTN